ncbi:MAG: sigma-70 family RNA polymerase sigma factor, partial [Actinomycetota bacterium]
ARAWMHWGRVGSLERPDLWTKRVAIHLGRSWWRHQQAAARAAKRQGGAGPSDSGWDDRSRDALREAVQQLPTRQRAALALRYFDDLPVAEAARILGCKEGTVGALTAQAIDSLRKSFVVQGEVSDHE